MAEAAREACRLDQVLFVPTGIPPHKRAPKTDVKHRLAMLRLALRSNAAFRIEDWEVRQKRTVYTHETLAHFSKKWPKDTLTFIIGSDSLEMLPTWRRGKELIKQYTFAVIERPETPWAKIAPRLTRSVRRVPCLPVPFASHDIRTRVRQKRSIRYLVPAAVERYIQSHRLYRKPE